MWEVTTVAAGAPVRERVPDEVLLRGLRRRGEREVRERGPRLRGVLLWLEVHDALLEPQD